MIFISKMPYICRLNCTFKYSVIMEQGRWQDYNSLLILQNLRNVHMYVMVEFCFLCVWVRQCTLMIMSLEQRKKINPRIKLYPKLYIVRMKSSSLEALENVKALSWNQKDYLPEILSTMKKKAFSSRLYSFELFKFHDFPWLF